MIRQRDPSPSRRNKDTYPSSMKILASLPHSIISTQISDHKQETEIKNGSTDNENYKRYVKEGMKTFPVNISLNEEKKYG